jgi:hypothetical protein
MFQWQQTVLTIRAYLRAARPLVASVLLMASGAARAQDTAAEPDSLSVQAAPLPHPEQRKPLTIVLGGRIGFELPLGDVVVDYSLHDATSGLIPVGFDAVIQHRGGLELGLYAQVQPGFKGKALNGCGDCSVLGFRIGAQLNKHFNLTGTVDPWIGIGIGYQELSFSQKGKGTGVTSSGGTREVDIEYSWSYRAFPEALIQAGLDFGTGHLRFGPLLSASISRYSSVNEELKCTSFGCSGLESSSSGNSIASSDRKVHAYIFIGVRGSYRL